jgi:hypothetical protein
MLTRLFDSKNQYFTFKILNFKSWNIAVVMWISGQWNNFGITETPEDGLCGRNMSWDFKGVIRIVAVLMELYCLSRYI